MRGRIVLGVVVTALLAVSVALAGPPAGKGKPEGAGKPAGKGKPTSGLGCRPAVQVVLKGTLASAPGAGTSFTMTVKSGNAHAKAFVSGAQPVTIQLTPATKVRRQGGKSAAGLLTGDRVLVQARVCKADLAAATAPALTAAKVIAHPASGDSDDDDEKKEKQDD
jgi:hypothetical protein